MRKFLCGAVVLLLFTSLLCLGASAVENEAECVNGSSSVTDGRTGLTQLMDDSSYTRYVLSPGTELTVRSEREIGGLYIRFCTSPGQWSLITDGEERLCGANGFLHEYVSGLDCHELTMRFQGRGELCDIFVLSKGSRPDWVQDWQPCWDRADVMLLPAHSDDDELYFAGVIPWCLEQGARVQVVYFINHYDEMFRRNELLDGLWAAGLRNYPVLGAYDDMGTGQENHLRVYAVLQGKSWADFESRQVELYRRFRPQVVIAHAEDGEYGHGAHKLCHQVTVKCAEVSGDPDVWPDTAEKYGTWTPLKVYAHNFPYNRIVLDLDSPLASYGGRSPFEVSRDAFRLHTSQFYYFYHWLFSADTAAGIELYNPCEYGLYSTLVGPDSSGNTFFDNIVLYDEQERLAEEERIARQEELDRAAEAAAQAAAEAERQAEQAREAALEQLERSELELRLEQRRLSAIVFSLSCLASGCVTWLIIDRKSHRKENLK